MRTRFYALMTTRICSRRDCRTSKAAKSSSKCHSTLIGYGLQAVNARIAFDGLQSPTDSTFDLQAYDQAFLAASGERQ